MTKWIAASAFGLLAMTPPAAAAPLIGDLSTYRIDMDSSFAGTRVFLFGARNDVGDVVMVIRGPGRDYIVRKKENIAGLWVNHGRMKLFDVPAFYAVAASKKLSDIEQKALFKRLNIGEENVFHAPSDPQMAYEFEEYAGAFLAHKHAQRLYTTDAETVRFMGETLFKAAIEFPDNIPPGNYTAEMYLISDGRVTGTQTMPITVDKVGLDAWLYNQAHHRPVSYGLMAVLFALTAGWIAGRIFEKV